MTIGERIKSRRIELDLTVDELAKRLGKNRATVYRYESDDIENLPTTVLETLAKALSTTPAILMGWTNDYAHSDSHNNFAAESHAVYGSFIDRVKVYSDKLNEKGRKQLLNTAKEMTFNPLYNDNYLEVVAAQERSDKEYKSMSEEEKLEAKINDDNIMNDNDF